MNMEAKTIDKYIAGYPESTQEILEKIRETIHSAAPGVTEKINYGIPTFVLNKKNLVHFGAYPHHIGFYPGPPGIAAIQKELKEYETSKGTVKFPLDKPIPYDLIQRITKFRVAQILK